MVQLINALTPLDEARAILGKEFDLKFTKAVEKETADIYDRVKDRIPEIEWQFYAPLIREINKLKREKDAVILAHNYQTPQIFHGVADVVGDSLQLAIEATKVKQQTIIQCGVHFMAETSKLLNPEKNRFDSRQPRWLFAGIVHHARRCDGHARAISGRACGDLCEHIGGGESSDRHLLHLLQCPRHC